MDRAATHNGWTLGQFRLLHVALAAYLLAHFWWLARWETGSVLETRVAPLVGAAACAALAAGVRTRLATLFLALAWTLAFINDTLSGQQTKLFLWLILLVQLAVPQEKDLKWRMPERVYQAAWIVTALFYALAGFGGLGVAGRGISLELFYAPLALIRPLRPWLWTAMLLTHLVRSFEVDQTADNLGRAVAHLLTFNPAWIPSRDAARIETVLYDGTCGLCHRFVRMVLLEDADGSRFRFAPLPESALADTVVVRTGGGELMRSAAVLHVLGRLGGVWRVIAAAGRIVPRAAGDAMYDRVARARKSLFRQPKDVCPVMLADLRARFDLGTPP